MIELYNSELPKEHRSVQNEEQLINLIEQKKKKNANLNWRVRDENHNIIGYIAKYTENNDFIIYIDKEINSLENKYIIINHPLIGRDFKFKISVLWKKEIDDFVNSFGTSFKNDENNETDNIEDIMEYLKLFYQ